MKYIETPNLPKNKISGVLIDYRTPENIISSLKKLNICVLKTRQNPNLYSAVDGHGDMVITHIKNNVFVCAPDSYKYFCSILPDSDIICGSSELTDTYPSDIAYNVARVGDYAFHNAKYTDKIILEYFDRHNIKLINVNQGYSKCSICVVDENSVITSDKGIASQAYKNNFDVLLIKPGYISLPGMNYGFIGGCTGKICENTLAVCGNLINHPDYKNIENFCSKKNVDLVMLSEDTPVDIGTLVPLYY